MKYYKHSSYLTLEAFFNLSQLYQDSLTCEKCGKCGNAISVIVTEAVV